MQVILAQPRGFCAGVVRAVEFKLPAALAGAALISQPGYGPPGT
jgi:4-hydroxy-3-methylbut-2-enyl diphosphate reductase IspH